jgi:NAD(P)-dependent dehydrogenase (short-subunit alcohol dehydrogenase family)
MTVTQPHDRVALVAGATARTAEVVLRRFLDAGFQVGAVARDADKLRAVAERLAARDRLLPIVADLSHVDGAERAAAETATRFGRIDAMTTLVGAGFSQKPFAETSLDELRRVVEGNLYTTYLLCRAVVPRMLAQGNGYIATVAGGSALDPGYGRSLFAASKAAIVALTKGIARDHKQQGIRANCLVAGGIATDAAKRYLSAEDFANASTMEEFADALVYLCSPGASGLSGAVIELNGREVD